MRWRAFVLFNFLGAAVWVTAIASTGYLFGQHWRRLLRAMQRFNIAVLVWPWPRSYFYGGDTAAVHRRKMINADVPVLRIIGAIADLRLNPTTAETCAFYWHCLCNTFPLPEILFTAA